MMSSDRRRIAGLNALKPEAKNHILLAKTYQIERARPRTVTIGSSVVQIGVDPADPAWPARTQPVYNYGIPGGGLLFLSFRTLQQAAAAGTLKNAIVFLDFQNFPIREQPAPEPTEDERRFQLIPDGDANPDRPAQVAKDKVLALATMGALTDSVTTILSQATPNLLDLAPNGATSQGDFISHAREDGMYAIFAPKEQLEVARVDILKHDSSDASAPMPNLGVVASIIAFAKAHDIKLTLVITPHHADALELYWRNGLWPQVEQFKAQLAKLVSRQDQSVVIWDFMDYSGDTTETVPKAGAGQQTRWFWEPTHFKTQLGHAMLERIFGAPDDGFGSVLTPDDVDARNQAIRAQRQTLICERHVVFLTEIDKPPGRDCSHNLRVSK